MADRERDRPVEEPPGSRPYDAPHQHPLSNEGPREGDVPCPECACPRLTLITDSNIVSVFKCPRCGHLSAPLKSE
jgi:hypothetical protein